MTAHQLPTVNLIRGRWMEWLSTLERTSMPLRKYLAEKTAPDPATLGYPLFSARIKDRKRRWQTEQEPNPYSAVSSKLDGSAYMRALGYSVPEIYGIYPSIDEIPQFDTLPRNFVLKPTAGWSEAGVLAMRDGVDLFHNRSFTRDAFIRSAKSIRGPQMEGMAGPWIAEELLLHFDGSGELAHDCKFFCFGPKVVAIQVNKRTGLKKPKFLHWYQDPDWKRLPYQFIWKNHPERSELTRPNCLDEMLRIASDVGGRLNIFLRIDMYATDRGPVFGEFTAYPHGGRHFTPRADAWLGSHWKTPEGGIDC